MSSALIAILVLAVCFSVYAAPEAAIMALLLRNGLL